MSGKLSEGSAVGTFAAIVVAVIWGLSFVAARAVLTTLTPLVLAALRFSVASVIFVPLMAREYLRGFRPTLRDVRELALLGFMSTTIYFWLQYTGVKYAGAGVSALLVVGLIPILTGLASTVLLKERFSAQKALGTVTGLSGVALIALPNLFVGNVDLLFYLGVVSLLMNAVLFSMYSTLSRRIMQRVRRPLTVTAYTIVTGTMALIPLSLTSDWNPARSLQPGQWVSVLYLAVVCSFLGYFLWNFALSRIEAVKATVWLYLEPVSAFIGEAIIFGVVPTPVTLVGGCAILLGALLTNRARK